MSARKLKTGQRGDVLPEETRPENPLDGFDVQLAVAELNAAASDGKWFCDLIDKAEKTRLCDWAGKTGTGRKDDSRASKAKPWPGAADHEVHLVQELLDERDAARVAALSRGALSVTPMDGTDARKAALMKQVLRYHLGTAMKSQMLVHGLRMGNWADRWGHSLLYVGWRTERAVERRKITLGELVQAAVAGMMEQGGGDGSAASGGGEQIQIVAEDMVMESVLDPARLDEAAALMLAADEGLRARGTAGLNEARRAIQELRRSKELATAGSAGSMDPMALEVSYVSSFVKHSAPCWEALRPFVDVFFPVETVYEDNLDSARWIARVKRLSASQLKEQAVIHKWDKAWVKEVLENHRGKSSGFNELMGTPWAMNNTGTRWRTRLGSDPSGGETRKNLYEIVELHDRSTTPDGLTGTYHTVFSTHVPDKVAKRKLLEYWSGCYPYIACVAEKTELMLLDSRGLPERLKDDQDALKVQKDSRTNAASLSTLPIWTGPPELRGTVVQPGKFLEQYRTGEVAALQIPPPDGRSVEIEKTIRQSVDRRFGRMSEAVPEALSMLMQQAEMDRFLVAVSQAVALTAKLVQQFMPPLTAARITGTGSAGSTDAFSATPDEVRGSYDFTVSFDVRGLDMEWAEQMLTFVKDMLIPLDRRGQIKTGPLIEFGLNLLSPSLTNRCYVEETEANAQEAEAAKASMADIFTGGAGADVTEGQDYGTRAQTMVDEFKRSPVRQQAVQTVPQIKEVFTARLKQLVDNIKQHTDNVLIGQQMGETPLMPQSDAEQLLGLLEGVAVAG